MKNVDQKLREEFGNLNSSSIINHALKYIKVAEINESLTSYWKYLIMIQFALQFSSNSKLLPSAKESNIKRLLRLISQIEDEYILKNFGFKDSVSTRKTMSIFSNQQFWLYQSWPDYDLARNLILFVDLADKEDKFDGEFRKITQLSIINFIHLSFWIHLGLSTDVGPSQTRTITKKEQLLLSALTSPHDAESFIDALTLTVEQPKGKRLSDFIPLKSPYLQPFDIRHWVMKPLLRHEDAIHLISRKIYNQTIKYYIYECLKHEPIFQSRFSSTRLEKYIELGLREATIQFVDEKSLNKSIARKSKVIDFLVEDSILIECKATELSIRASVEPIDEKLYGSTKTTIAKAYSQFYEFGELLNRDNLFAVIVTFKPMYLGNGEDVALEMMKDFVSGLRQEQVERLPPGNIFILSLDEWDMLVQLAIQKALPIREVLERVKYNQAIQRNSFIGHLDIIRGNDEFIPFKFLQERYADFYAEISSPRFREKVGNFRPT